MAELIIFVSEREQVPDVVAYCAELTVPYRIVALDFWAERALRNRHVKCESLSIYCPPWHDFERELLTAERIAREWYRTPEMLFFTHLTVPIGTAVEIALDSYLQQTLYYMECVQRVIDAQKTHKLVIFCSKRHVLQTEGPLAVFEARLIPDVVRFFAHTRGLAVECHGIAAPLSSVQSFPPQSIWKIVLPKIYNALIRFLPQKPIKIFASEYWSHIASLMECMDDAEMVLMDRSEARNIPWQALWKHRVRLMHPLTERGPAIQKISSEKKASFQKEWNTARARVAQMPEFLHNGVSWWPVVEEAFNFLVETYAERVVSDAEAIKKILMRERINRVVLRASMSLHQHHFFVTACIARLLGIPSIELQHARARYDAHTANSRLETDYLAAYGELTREMQIKNHGITPERVRLTGSPRFARYFSERRPSAEDRAASLRARGLNPTRPVIVATVPPHIISLGVNDFTSYEVADFFQTLQRIHADVHGIQFIFKIRPGFGTAVLREYIKELFPRDTVIAEREDIFSLFLLCDIAFAPNSTVLLEAMIAGKPVILFPWRPYDEHLPIYREGCIAASKDTIAETVRRLLGDPSYYGEMVRRGERFLIRDYFAGDASKRVADFLREPLSVTHDNMTNV